LLVFLPFQIAAESQPGSVKLLVGLGSAIIQTLGTADAPVKEVINISNQEATGIDFDCNQQRIVWSDMQGVHSNF
jgi:hypothetical protein